MDLLERDIPDGRPVAPAAGGFSLDVGHDEIVTIRLEYEETSPRAEEAGLDSSGDDGCGCSSLEPGAPDHLEILYACVFWLLILLIPFFLRRGFRQVR